MAKLNNSIGDTIGGTPLVRLKRIGAPDQAEILVKTESRNPLGSVKDRIGLSMIDVEFGILFL